MTPAILGGPHSGCPYKARAGGQRGSRSVFTQDFVGIDNICFQKVLFFKTAIVSFCLFLMLEPLSQAGYTLCIKLPADCCHGSALYFGGVQTGFEATVEVVKSKS